VTIKALARLVLPGTLPLLASSSVLSAQIAGTLDGAATRISYSEGTPSTGLSVAPSLQVIRPWQSVIAGGAVTRFPGDVWSVQGHIAGSTYLGPVGAFRPELEGRLRGTRHEDGGGSSEFTGAARLHRFGAAHGVWIGANGGRSWDGLEWRGTVGVEAGGWARVGPGTLSVALTGSRLNDDLRFAEAEGALRMDRGPLEIVAHGGLRHWFRPDDAAAEGWGGASIAWWIHDRLALTAAGGAYPVDYAQGLPSGTFGSLGIRVSTGRLSRARRINEPLDLLLPPIRPGAPGLAFERLGDGSARITVGNVDAQRVELMGDFTGWEPIALPRSGEREWAATLPVPAGIHRVNLRVDGGQWIVPPGLPSSTDEFGGAAGILIVE
jgi:hypothetical protein